MKHLLIFCLLLVASAGFSQTSGPIRIYRVGDQVIIKDGAGGKPASYAYGKVSVTAYDYQVRVVIDNLPPYYLLPNQFLNQAGSLYGSTVDDAVNAWTNAIPSISGGSSSTATTSTATATYGTVQPTVTDYTNTATITTTGVIDIFIENIGTASGAFSFAGAPYTMPVGEQRRFRPETDRTSGKLSPYPIITVNGTGTTIRVTKYFQQ